MRELCTEMEKRIFAVCLFVAVLGCIVLIASAEAEESHSREIRASDKSKASNGTSFGSAKGKGGTTSKPGSVTTNRSGKQSSTRKFGNSQRPRAPITGKPVDPSSKPKPKTLSPLLAPRNPKHKTTTTTTEEPEFDDEEEEED